MYLLLFALESLVYPEKRFEAGKYKRGRAQYTEGWVVFLWHENRMG